MPGRCPFYGFRWPDNSGDLHRVGGNECGLDVQENRPCKMEQQGRTVNYDYCDVPIQWKPILEAFRERIHFHVSEDSKPLTFAEWRDIVMRRKAS